MIADVGVDDDVVVRTATIRVTMKNNRKHRIRRISLSSSSFPVIAVTFMVSLGLFSLFDVLMIDCGGGGGGGYGGYGGDGRSSNSGIIFCQAKEQQGPLSLSFPLSFPSLESAYSSVSKARIVIPNSSILSIDCEINNIIDNIVDNEIAIEDNDDDYESEFGSSSGIGNLLFNENSYNHKSPSFISHRQRQRRRRIAMIDPISVHRSSISKRRSSSDGCHLRSSPSQQQRLSSSSSSSSSSSYKKTGTTIAGCVVIVKNDNDSDSKQYVILGADTRATEGTIVADKRCDKIHKLSSNCRCCGAGTSADLDKLTRQVLFHIALQQHQSQTNQGNNANGSSCFEANGPIISTSTTTSTSTSLISSLNKNSQNTGCVELLYQTYNEDDDDNDDDDNNNKGDALLWMRPVSIDVLCTLFQNTLFNSKGQIGANLIIGGVWNGKAYLRAIHPHGSTDVNLPFAALGSGGLAAISILEEGHTPNLTLQEGIELVKRAIVSGIKNDLGSGSQVDLCIIGPDGTATQIRGAICEEQLLPDHNNDNSSSSSDDNNNNNNNTTNTTNRLMEILNRNKNDYDNDAENDNDVDVDVDEGSHGKKKKNWANIGVSGFGNQPFAIESIKQRMVSTEIDEARRRKIWDRVLGLK